MPGYAAERPAGREHIPLYPKGFVAVRILQLLFGVICLGLTAYSLTVLPTVGGSLMIFTAVVCLITSIYLLVAHFGPPGAYNYWAILALDIFHVIFWLVSFALVATQAAFLLSIGTSSYYFDDDYNYHYYYGSGNALIYLGAIFAAAAGIGAAQWLIYLIALILHSVALHRHRKAGLRAMPGDHASAPAVNAPAVGVAPVGVEKYQMQPQPPANYYAPPQGGYYEAPVQQPVPQQQPPQQHQ